MFRGTILDLCATNLLQHDHKFSIVHNLASDHSILFASVSRKVSRTSVAGTKSKLNLNAAAHMVNQLCSERNITCANELNIELANIVQECTSTLTI